MIDALERLAATDFTGRLNVLRGTDSRLLGAVSLRGGVLVGCSYRGGRGLADLVDLLVERGFAGGGVRCVPEPETPPEGADAFRVTLRRLLADVGDRLRRARPPGHLRLDVRDGFLESGPDLAPGEMDVLDAVLDHGRVDDIYERSGAPDHLVTGALVSLGKMGALRVVGP